MGKESNRLLLLVREMLASGIALGYVPLQDTTGVILEE